jgi:uncharacterized membrane protein YkvA (DUF1232 family)
MNDESTGKGGGTPPPGSTLSSDYETAKKALGNLWESLAKEAHTRFSGIAEQVEKKFQESREHIKESDVKDALNKAGGKIEKLAQSASAEAQKLAKQAKLLYMMLRDTVSGKFKAPWVTVAAITACLLYLINPIDIIPDFIPGVGLIDDALVVALCISLVRIDLRRYAAEMGLKLEEYGL